MSKRRTEGRIGLGSQNQNETPPSSSSSNLEHQDSTTFHSHHSRSSSLRNFFYCRKMGVAHALIGLPLALILYVYHNNSSQALQAGPIVQISNGLVQGNLGQSRDGRVFYEFLGVPFARPPVKLLRFEPPQLAQNWDGVRPAIAFGSQCMQIEFFTGKILGNEDCLYLNVFTPINVSDSAVNKALVPVMIFIHGGYFMSGSSNIYRPDYLMDKDIVLVTLNYRLASLGFLNMGNHLIRGNMGLKDQAFAMQWVQKNVKNFGGDPGRVTIFGPSAGGAAVHYHTLSPLSKGLFHKAISQSGTAIKVWSFVDNPGDQAVRLGKKLNCPTGTSLQLVNCLKNLDAFLIISTHREYLDVLLHPLALFAPTVESVIDETTFLSDHPYSILIQGKQNPVPWLTGLNSEEGLLFSSRILKNSDLMAKLNSDWSESMPLLLGYSEHPNKHEITRQVQRFYFQDEIPNFLDRFENYTNMLSDRLYFTATHEAILLQSRTSPVYIYYYTYPADFSFAQILALSGTFPPILEISASFGARWIKQNILGKTLNNLGICHGDELIMLFNLGILSNIKTTDKEYPMSKKMVQLWTDFASQSYTGAPLEVDQVQWIPTNPSSQSQLNYLNLDSHSKIIDEPFTARVNFWKSMGLL